MKLFDSPLMRVYELTAIVDFVNSCETLEHTSVATKMVDKLQESQPEETEVIQSLREVICDMSFDFYLEKYRK